MVVVESIARAHRRLSSARLLPFRSVEVPCERRSLKESARPTCRRYRVTVQRRMTAG